METDKPHIKLDVSKCRSKKDIVHEINKFNLDDQQKKELKRKFFKMLNEAQKYIK